MVIALSQFAQLANMVPGTLVFLYAKYVYVNDPRDAFDIGREFRDGMYKMRGTIVASKDRRVPNALLMENTLIHQDNKGTFVSRAQPLEWPLVRDICRLAYAYHT